MQPQMQGRKIPTSLGQLSGNGGISADALNGFGGFDPVTGMANGVVRSFQGELTQVQQYQSSILRCL